jgi:LppX_LprAFG lipoprotein
MKIRLYPMMMAVAAFLALGGGILVACGEEPQNVDPQVVLSATSAKMKQIAGFHFVYQVHVPESALSSVGGGIVKVEGDINAAGNMKAEVELIGGGVLFNVDFVALEDVHYIKYPLTTEWQSMAPEESPIGDLNLSAFSIKILDRIAGATYEGTEKKGGTKCYHISGMVTGEDVEQIAGSVSKGDLFETDLYVGIDDGLLREVDIKGPMTTSEVEGTWRSIALSNLDVAVDVEAPQ